MQFLLINIFFKHPLTRELVVDITVVEYPAAVEFVSIVEIEARDEGASTSNATMFCSNIAAVSSTNQAHRKIPTNIYDNDAGYQILVNILQSADSLGFDNLLGVDIHKKWMKSCKQNWFKHGFIPE
jgi:hypothetical protein